MAYIDKLLNIKKNIGKTPLVELKFEYEGKVVTPTGILISCNEWQFSKALSIELIENCKNVFQLGGWTDEEFYDKPDEKIIADFIFDRVKNKYIRLLHETLGDITEEEGEELIRYAEFIKSRRGKKWNLRI